MWKKPSSRALCIFQFFHLLTERGKAQNICNFPACVFNIYEMIYVYIYVWSIMNIKCYKKNSCS